MQIRCIFLALALGGVVAANPALARDNARGNWTHNASQSTTISDRNSNSGNQQRSKQQSFMPSNRNFAPRSAPPNSQLPQPAQRNFHQNWNRNFSTSHAPNDNGGAGRNFNRNWNNPAHNSWNASRDRNGTRDWNGNRRNNNELTPGAHQRSEWNNYHFSSRDVSRFNSSERNRWTHGRWHHGRHNHRFGWWWFANGGWFFYDQPIYPYPGYVSSDAYYGEDYSDGGNYDYDYDGDSGDSYSDDSGAASANDGYWYYCRDPEGYYPDIRKCRTDWQRVSPRPDSQDYNDNSDNGPDEGGVPYDNGPESPVMKFTFLEVT